MRDQAEFPLFDKSGYAVRAPAVDEQRVLPISGTLQAEYDAWRKTELGAFIYGLVRAEAIKRVRNGNDRIGVKGIVEDVRSEHHVTIDNSLVALVARELIDNVPELRDVIECRQRSAA